MVSINLKTFAIVAGGVYLAMVAVWWIWRRKKESAPHKFTPIAKPKGNFIIYNYFPRHTVVIDIIENTDTLQGNTVRLVDAIRPLSTGTLTKNQVKEYIKSGNLIKISIISPSGEFQHFADYLVDTPEGEYIKNLHIGMITTRYIGSTDTLRATTTSGNAVGGNAFIRVHNPTRVPLSLNEQEVVVRPQSTEKYMGYRHQGVTLGTVFSDDKGLYPDFQLLEPFTDIYYGIVSDIRQPLSGCWQLEYSDHCEYGQTLWPFQEGVM